MKSAAAQEKQQSAYAKTKAQISFAVIAKLISAFVFATRIVQFLFFLNPKFQASNLLLIVYNPVCDRPGRNPNCWFSHAQAQIKEHTEPRIHSVSYIDCYPNTNKRRLITGTYLASTQTNKQSPRRLCNEPTHEKTNNLHRQNQRRRSASRLPRR